MNLLEVTSQEILVSPVPGDVQRPRKKSRAPQHAAAAADMPAEKAFGSLFALVALGAFVAGYFAGIPTVALVGVIAWGIWGLGAAATVLWSRCTGWQYLVVSAATGLSVLTLGGWILLELHGWGSARPMFFMVSALAAGVLLFFAPRATNASHKAARSLFNGFRGVGRMEFVVAVATVVGALLVVVGAEISDDLDPGSFGIFGSISPLWIVGLGILGLTLLLAHNRSPRVFAFTVMAIIVVVAVTPAIVYTLPRYDWTQKHIGVIRLFAITGHLHGNIDIYQSWPGFFAAFAWLRDVVQVDRLEAIARWWPAFIDVFDAIAVTVIAERLGFTKRQAWYSALFFSFTSVVWQDYFSPEAAGYFLALVIIGLVAARPNGVKAHQSVTVQLVFVGLLACAIAVSHQLTPFATAGLLVVLGIGRLARPRWSALVVAAPAVLWAALHFSAVTGHGAFSQLGNIVSNAQSPNAGHGYNYTLAPRLYDIGQVVPPVLVGILAAYGLYLRRDRTSFVLLLASASMSGLLFFRYGTETSLRSVLFALPTLALAAGYATNASEFVADSNRAIEQTSLRRSWRRVLDGRRRIVLGARLRWWIRWLGIPLLLGAFVMADFVDDGINALRPGDLAAMNYYEDTAAAQSVVLTVGGYVPNRNTARYPELNFLAVPLYQGDLKPGDAASVMRQINSSAAQVYSQNKIGDDQQAAVYLLFDKQSQVQLAIDGIAPEDSYLQLKAVASHNKKWLPLDRTDTALLLKFVPSGK